MPWRTFRSICHPKCRDSEESVMRRPLAPHQSSPRAFILLPRGFEDICVGVTALMLSEGQHAWQGRQRAASGLTLLMMFPAAPEPTRESPAVFPEGSFSLHVRPSVSDACLDWRHCPFAHSCHLAQQGLRPWRWEGTGAGEPSSGPSPSTLLGSLAGAPGSPPPMVSG